MPDKLGTVALYAVGASLAAIALFYIFGPSLYSEEENLKVPRKTGAVGLSNPANDCFINSTLQALAGLHDLVVFLDREAHRIESGGVDLLEPEGEEEEGLHDMASNAGRKESLKGGVVILALRNMLQRLNERPRFKRTISAGDFVSSLEYAFGSRVNRRQQDAQEFLQHVAERLHDEYYAGLKSGLHQEVLGPDSKDIGLKTLPESSESGKGLPLEGQLVSQIECQTCRFKPKPSVSSFVTLTLNVPSVTYATLDSCLDGLLRRETIDDYKCDRCYLIHILESRRQELERNPSVARKVQLEQDLSKITDAMDRDPEVILDSIDLANIKSAPKRRISRHVRISIYPKILAVHLSRSIFGPASFSTKNTAKVSFPEYLMLGGFDQKRYKLACLVTHRGGHNSGHYETFRRQPEALPGPSQGQSQHRKRKFQDRWWRISDDRIAECLTDDVLDMHKEAYLLFYELMEAIMS